MMLYIFLGNQSIQKITKLDVQTDTCDLKNRVSSSGALMILGELDNKKKKKSIKKS